MESMNWQRAIHKRNSDTKIRDALLTYRANRDKTDSARYLSHLPLKVRRLFSSPVLLRDVSSLKTAQNGGKRYSLPLQARQNEQSAINYRYNDTKLNAYYSDSLPYQSRTNGQRDVR